MASTSKTQGGRKSATRTTKGATRAAPSKTAKPQGAKAKAAKTKPATTKPKRKRKKKGGGDHVAFARWIHHPKTGVRLVAADYGYKAFPLG